MTNVIDKPNLTSDQQAMLATWQQHAHAEFVLKDADAALATMTENPYVFLVASGVGRVGRAAVREFYANKFLPNIPADLELTSLSQTFGADRIVEEMVMRFTHTIGNGLATSGRAPYGSKRRVRSGGRHSVRGRQNSQRASLLGPGDAALSDGRPGSPDGSGWHCKRSGAAQTSVPMTPAGL